MIHQWAATQWNGPITCPAPFMKNPRPLRFIHSAIRTYSIIFSQTGTFTDHTVTKFIQSGRERTYTRLTQLIAHLFTSEFDQHGERPGKHRGQSSGPSCHAVAAVWQGKTKHMLLCNVSFKSLRSDISSASAAWYQKMARYDSSVMKQWRGAPCDDQLK